MSNMVLIVGGPDSGERIKWFGHRVRYNRVELVLHRACFKDGTRREYYVKAAIGFAEFASMLDEATLERVEVCG